jgi:hypothetical protein
MTPLIRLILLLPVLGGLAGCLPLPGLGLEKLEDATMAVHLSTEGSRVSVAQLRELLSRNDCAKCHGDMLLLTEAGWRSSQYVNLSDWRKSPLLARERRPASTKTRVPSVPGQNENMPTSGATWSAGDFDQLANFVEDLVAGSVTGGVPGEEPKPYTGPHYEPKPGFSCADGSTEPSADGVRRLSREALIRSYSTVVEDVSNSGFASATMSVAAAKIAAIPKDSGAGASEATDTVVSDAHVQGWWDAAEEIAKNLAANFGLVRGGCALAAGAADAGGCVRGFLSDLATSAFSRAPTAEELDRIAGLYSAGFASLGGTTSLENAIQSVLMSPNFLYEIPEGTLVPGKTDVYRNSSRWQLVLTWLRVMGTRPPRSEVALAATTDFTQSANLADLVDRLLAKTYAPGESARRHHALAAFREWFRPGRVNVLPKTSDPAFISIWKETMGVAQGPSQTDKSALESAALESAERTFLLLAEQGKPFTEIVRASGVVAQTPELQKIYRTAGVSTALQEPGDGVRRGMVWVAANLFNPLNNGNAAFFSQSRRILESLACQSFSNANDILMGLPTGTLGSPPDDFTYTKTHRLRYQTATSNAVCATCHSNGLNMSFTGSGFGKLGQYRVAGGKPVEKIYDYNGSGALKATLAADERYWVTLPGVDRKVTGPGELVDALAQSGLLHSCYAERAVAVYTRRRQTASTTRDACISQRLADQLRQGAPAQDAIRAVLLDPAFIFHRK